MTTKNFDKLGMFFGPDNSGQAKNGILYVLYNCIHTFSDDSKTSIYIQSTDPKQLEKCNIYQLMTTKNYKDAVKFKKEGIHPEFVNFIRNTGSWHFMLEKEKLPNNYTIINNFVDFIVDYMKKNFGNKKGKQLTLEDFKSAMVNSPIETYIFTHIQPILRKKIEDVEPPETAEPPKTAETAETAETYAPSVKTWGEWFSDMFYRIGETYDGVYGSNKDEDEESKPPSKSKTADKKEKDKDDDEIYYESEDSAKPKFRLNLFKVPITIGGKITNFQSSIPLLPTGTIIYTDKDNPDTFITVGKDTNEYGLQHIYHKAFTRVTRVDFDTNDENKTRPFNLDMSKVADGIMKAHTVDFTASNLEKMFPVDLSVSKENLIYEYDGNQYNKVTGDKGNNLDIESLSGFNSKDKVDFINRCILNDNAKRHLSLCFDYLNDQDFFQIESGALIDLNLAKKILKRFKIGKYRRDNQPEEYNEWIKRISTRVDNTFDENIVKAIKTNTNLQKYLRALINLVKYPNGLNTQNMTFPRDYTEKELTRLYGVLPTFNPVKFSSNYIIKPSSKAPPREGTLARFYWENIPPEMILQKGGGDLVAAQILARGVKYHNATFSMAPLHHPIVSVSQFGRNIGGVQVGGGDANKLSGQIQTLINDILLKNNVSISSTDQEGINKMLSELRKHEENIQKFINLLKTLYDVHILIKDTTDTYNLNVENLLTNTTAINKINSDIENVKKCISNTTTKIQDNTEKTCKILVDLTRKVYRSDREYKLL